MIRSFSCENFKNVQAKDVEFAPINLLIGPNNSGKSNFLRALSFCTNTLSVAGTNSVFYDELKRNGGINILRQGANSKVVFLGLKADIQDLILDYTMTFTTGESAERPPLPEELMAIAQTDGLITRLDYSQWRLTMMERNAVMMPDTFDTFFQKMYTFFQAFYLFSSSSFNYEKIRQPQKPGSVDNVLDNHGSNFLNVYQAAKNEDTGFIDRFTRKARQLIEGLKDITVEAAEDKAEGKPDKVAMRLRFGGGNFWLSQVSDGTIEALLLALLTTLPEEMAPSVLAIDEPEVNLHPAWQKVIANWMQISGNVPQFFISTHSPDFLDAFTDGFSRGDVNVLVFSPSGREPVRNLDREKLRPTLEEGWMLGDLYRVGDPLIGGWPT